MKAKLIRNVVVKGEPKQAGKTIDVTKELHAELVELGVVRDPNAPEVQEATDQAEAEAIAKADAIVKEAEEKLAAANAQAEKIVSDAEAEAKKLIEDAEAKAKAETDNKKSDK